jgi:hypothetical protein
MKITLSKAVEDVRNAGIDSYGQLSIRSLQIKWDSSDVYLRAQRGQKMTFQGQETSSLETQN